MTTQDFTTTLLVDATPEQVFAAILNVRGWWSEQIEGRTDELGAVFTFRFEDHHRSTHEITELVPGQRVVWKTVDASINFVADKQGDKTALRFTHVGLVPEIECHTKCSRAWTFHLGSLRDLITTGKGQPNR